MKKFISVAVVATLLSLVASAQTNLYLLPGNLAVFQGGNGTTGYAINTAKEQPSFVLVFDPTITNQTVPLLSVALPTNGASGLWINAHAGSEGGAISRSADRRYLSLAGYVGTINASASTPSSATSPIVSRGFGLLDAFGNFNVLYSDQALWFGLPSGVTQNNPTGIATTDGTNFWGTGNVTGSASSASSTLFYNSNYNAAPQIMQNLLQGASESRIINGVLYISAFTSKGALNNGIYNFVDPANGNAVVPLPFDPNVSNSVQHTVQTNLVINWGSTYANIANFDMDASNTVAYGADQTYGIVKFTNNGGVWSAAPYYFSSTNLGTTAQSKSAQGCFGICVDFSGTNPVIYATTMEQGDAKNTCSNRLIRIVDTGSPGTNRVAQTLAVATNINDVFRGIDFTPDLRPVIASSPANASTTNGGSASFSFGVTSAFALNYQWLQNSTNLPGATNALLSLTGLSSSFNGYIYQCIASNQYGAVTSSIATLTVTTVATPPVITNSVANVTNFVGSTVSFATITPSGTPPFTYRWYFGTTALGDDGVKYFGSHTSALSITNTATADSGNYYVVVSNSVGFASNLVDTLTIIYQLPTILTNGPQSATALVGANLSLSISTTGGTQPLTYQWYRGSTALSNAGEYSGVDTTNLVITSAGTVDSGNYTAVVSNGGGSVTSSVAVITILVPPAHSFVGYSNQVYTQNFDSLPDPGSNSVNSINNPMDAGSILGVAYSLANPFDFAYPITTTGYGGGLALTNLSGWYGAADTLLSGVDGLSRFGAQNGDQTAGGVIDFGANDTNGPTGTNRALGLLSTSSTGSTTFALKLVNQSTNALNYVSLAYTGELWRNGTTNRTIYFGYTVDATATNFTLSAQSISNATAVSNLGFSFPTVATSVAVDGTLPANQVALSASSLALSNSWPAGGALWLIWSIDYNGKGNGNGYAIDNLTFSASANAAAQPSRPILGGVLYSPTNGLSFSFTNISGASFTVYGTTNLSTPISWTSLGAPTETTNSGYSTYRFTDIHASTNSQRFYKVTSP